MVSSQRLVRFSKLDQLDELVKKSDKKLKDKEGWPTTGELEFQNVADGEGLREFKVKILSGMKVGVLCSDDDVEALHASIVKAVFRLTDLSGGKVLLDGVDTQELGLHLLRSSVGYIPRNPNIFFKETSIRDILDPEAHFSNEILENALRQVNLYDILEDGLSTST